MNKILLSCLFMFLIISCGDKYIEYNKHYKEGLRDNPYKGEEGELLTGVVKDVDRFLDDRLEILGAVKNGVFHGRWTEYSWGIGSDETDIISDSLFCIWENGLPTLKSSHYNGEKDTMFFNHEGHPLIYKDYYENGQLRAVVNFIKPADFLSVLHEMIPHYPLQTEKQKKEFWLDLQNSFSKNKTQYLWNGGHIFWENGNLQRIWVNKYFSQEKKLYHLEYILDLSPEGALVRFEYSLESTFMIYNDFYKRYYKSLTNEVAKNGERTELIYKRISRGLNGHCGNCSNACKSCLKPDACYYGMSSTGFGTWKTIYTGTNKNTQSLDWIKLNSARDGRVLSYDDIEKIDFSELIDVDLELLKSSMQLQLEDRFQTQQDYKDWRDGLVFYGGRELSLFRVGGIDVSAFPMSIPY